MKTTLTVFLLIIVTGLGAGFYFAVDFLNSAPSTRSAKVIFAVKKGEPFRSVATRLKQRGIITSALRFRVFARVSKKSSALRMGEYSLRQNMFPTDVLQVITSGVSTMRSITFQEGLNLHEMAAIVERSGIASAKEFLKLAYDRKLIKKLLKENFESLEGYLFPETYRYTKFTTATELITMMVAKFHDEIREIKRVSAVSGFSQHQIVIFASIVEKETGASKERPLISSVFHNRLRKNMRLQTDPTVLYGILDRTGKMTRNIRKRDLLAKNRYNTYTFKGLPFGPISNPGREALHFAVRPASTEYLYFVSRNDGTSVFSKNYADHHKAVLKYQRRSSARKGKSWRDLKQ